MDWLKRFMYGRYGGDQLSICLLVLSLILTIIGRVSGIAILSIISYIPVAIAVYRIFSKDIKKRSMENYKFAILISPVYSKFKRFQGRIQDSKTHKYFKCKKCKTTLRVPKGKGKILITCPKCKEQYTKKT